MKKILISLIILLTLTGCSNKDKVIIDNNKETTYFPIANNYKKGVSGFYIVNNLSNRIDTKEVELGLMTLSTNYFNNSNSYYQNGLYLDRKKLSKIIKEINNQPIEINNQKYKIPVISYIYETNYVNHANDLKGISLAIAINSNQLISGQNIELSNDDIKKFIIQNSHLLIEPIRNIKSLSDKKIVVGIFKLKPMDSLLPGHYIARGIAKDNKITNLININQQKLVMNSDEVKVIDELNYKNYINLENDLRKKYNNILIQGIANYSDKDLTELDININVGAVSVNMIMSIGQDIINNIQSNFNNKNIKVVIKNDNNATALVVFNQYNKNGSIYLLP